jgi:hypothetical protein
MVLYSQAKATLAQFDVQHRINCTICSTARKTNMTRVTTRSASCCGVDSRTGGGCNMLAAAGHSPRTSGSPCPNKTYRNE